MPLSAQDISRVRQSFDDLEPRLEPTSIHFYEVLFRRAPELRVLFREDLKGQGMRFMNTLGLILADIEHPDRPAVNYSELGKLHRMLGIRQADFEPMGEALMESLRAKLGDGFTPELETAWRHVYQLFTEKLVASGNIPE